MMRAAADITYCCWDHVL